MFGIPGYILRVPYSSSAQTDSTIKAQDAAFGIIASILQVHILSPNIHILIF